METPELDDRQVREGRLHGVFDGPPPPSLGEERFFGRAQAVEACGWALAGGIAIHRRGGWSGPAVRVLGRQAVLVEWGCRHGLSPRCLRSVRRGLPPHFDLSGPLAQRLERGARPRQEAR